MGVSGTNLYGWSYWGTGVDPNRNAGTGNNQVDKMSYLRLIVAQLRNQNPLDPMDNAQFLTQLAQFNTLEQMQGLNEQVGRMVGAQAESGQRLADIGRTLDEMLKVQQQILLYQQGQAGTAPVA